MIARREKTNYLICLVLRTLNPMTLINHPMFSIWQQLEDPYHYSTYTYHYKSLSNIFDKLKLKAYQNEV